MSKMFLYLSEKKPFYNALFILKTNKSALKTEMTPFIECKPKSSLRWTSTRCCSLFYFVFLHYVCVRVH